MVIHQIKISETMLWISLTLRMMMLVRSLLIHKMKMTMLTVQRMEETPKATKPTLDNPKTHLKNQLPT